MSWSIDTAFVNNYRNQLELQFQQAGSRLRNAVTTVTQRSEYDYFDQVGTVTANSMSTRHGDTPLDDITHTRRRNQIQGYNNALLFDNQDKLKTIIDPTSGYARAQAMALGRQMDTDIIVAARATAYTGKTGSGTEVWASAGAGNIVAVDYVDSGAAVNSNLTIAKLREARRILNSHEAVMDGEPLTCVITSAQEQALLRSTEVTSADYNAVKALVHGEVNSFLGFDFIRTELLEASGTVRSVLCFPKSAIVCGIAEELKVRIDERSDKNYSTQVYSEATFGATRLWWQKMIEIKCDEA